MRISEDVTDEERSLISNPWSSEVWVVVAGDLSTFQSFEMAKSMYTL